MTVGVAVMALRLCFWDAELRLSRLKDLHNEISVCEMFGMRSSLSVKPRGLVPPACEL